MKKIFQGLGLGLIALALVVGVEAGTADAALTLGALTVTSDGALTITSTAAAMSLNGTLTNTIKLNSRTDSTSTTGDFIGAQIKPGVGVTKTTGGVTGVEISPRVNNTFELTTGSVIGAHIDAYLKGTTGDIGGDVRGAQIELVTDDAGARTITGDVTGLRFRSAFSATAITGNFQAIKIEAPETQTNSQTYDSVLTLTSTVAGVWDDTDADSGDTEAGYIKVLVNGNARYIQLYSDAP